MHTDPCHQDLTYSHQHQDSIYIQTDDIQGVCFRPRQDLFYPTSKIISRDKGLKFKLGLQIVPGPMPVVKQAYFTAYVLMEDILN